MLTSFLVTPSTQNTLIRDLIGNVSQPVIEYQCGDWSFLFRSNNQTSVPDIDNYKYREQNDELIIVGEVLNIHEIRTLAAHFDTNALSMNIAGVVWQLLKNFGLKSLLLMDGPFTVIHIDDNKGLVKVIADSLSLLPVHLVNSRVPWITSELKFLSSLSESLFEFEDESYVCSRAVNEDTFVPIRNVRKAKPLEMISLQRRTDDEYSVQSQVINEKGLFNNLLIDESDAIGLVSTMLTQSVTQCTRQSRVAIPLSGGLDSSIVTALASFHKPDVTTVSIGSEQANEFEYSRHMANTVGSHHEEVVLNPNDVMKGVVSAIYHNEIFDGLSSEIQASLFTLYDHCENRFDAIVTGYGADLLFGGVLDRLTPLEQVNPLLWKQVYRTRWTGEFSYFGAQHRGLNIYHPYWNSRLMTFCLNLNPKYKVDGDLKVILKKFAKSFDLVPEKIINRKKIGIHEGSFVNKLFANVLGAKSDDYISKTKFSYRLYKEFLQSKRKVDEVDIEKIVALTQSK